MNNFDSKKVVPRYRAIAILLSLLALVILGKTVYLMTAKHDYWMKVADRVKRDSVCVKPNRGNILSCNGKLLASSLPEFKIYMDFVALHQAENDTLWDEKEDSICMELHRIFPEKGAGYFKLHLN